jgi:FixJ family two-component response regulator
METDLSFLSPQLGPPGKSASSMNRIKTGAMHNTIRQAPTIFIVDDDEAVRIALRMLVISFGWNARAFESGQAFFTALPQNEPDCLLLDLDMPGMNGAEVQESLHAQGSGIPVIIITGQKNTQLVSRARAAGACGLLSKPFQDEELKLLIEQCLHAAH